MPWLETSLIDLRMQFIVDYQRGLQSVSELADRFGISRKTAYNMDRPPRGGRSQWLGGSEPTSARVSPRNASAHR